MTGDPEYSSLLWIGLTLLFLGLFALGISSCEMGGDPGL